MLFNEPKLLKSRRAETVAITAASFSALQRAEIAEIYDRNLKSRKVSDFSALQRAEIAEIVHATIRLAAWMYISVLFNEPKLLKCVVQSG